MVKKVVIRRFKKFGELVFDVPGHVVLAGPNNMGKTTVLQAIAAWSFAFKQWKTLNDFQKRHGAYTRKPVTRQIFSAVPLRTFELLWREKTFDGPIEIEVHSTQGWKVTMELLYDSTEQVYVRPKQDIPSDDTRNANLDVIYVPPMTGLSTDEPVYQRPKLDQLLGLAKPGEMLRNLLVEAHGSEVAWRELQQSIKTLFNYELCPPDSSVANIVAEYIARPGGPRYDIASAGSGFQQVLMLLTFLNTRPASVLLLDEPDAHLHIILQDAIYSELKAVAARQSSQLIVATHSEVIIDTVDPRELMVMLDTPRLLVSTEERETLKESLRILGNTDIMLAKTVPGILYLEGHTDLDILREWARILNHPTFDVLKTKAFWKPIVSELRLGGSGIRAEGHYEALKLVRKDLPALMLLDRDNNPNVPETKITGTGLQRLRWRRYEIESYLLHPAAIARYVEQQVGSTEVAKIHLQDLQKHFQGTYPPDFLKDPFKDLPFLVGTKARTELIPPALAAAGLPGIDYTRYHEIAAIMLPEEIHPEVKEKLDAMKKAFRL